MDGIILFAKLNAVSAQVDEILRSMADPYDPAHTYTAGQLVMYAGRLYRALVDIITPEAWTPEHWQAVNLKASDSVVVEEDGTARAYADVRPEDMATDEEVAEVLEGIFGAEE